MLPLREKVASDSENVLLGESVYEKKKVKKNKTHGETKNTFESFGKCCSVKATGSFKLTGSVDNLLLHRRWDRVTLAAYWNCNLAVSMTTKVWRSFMAIPSHIAQCDTLESIHIIRPQCGSLK